MDVRRSGCSTFNPPYANDSSVFQSWHRAAKHSDRGLWQCENGPGISSEHRAHRRMVRIGVAVGPIVDPHILLTTPGGESDRSDEKRILFSLRVIENHAHRVRLGFVPVDQHHRPRPIGTMNDIRRHQQISLCVLDVVDEGNIT